MATGAARKSVGRNLSLQPLWRVLGDHDTRGFTAEAAESMETKGKKLCELCASA
jgi:hypothetical protein